MCEFMKWTIMQPSNVFGMHILWRKSFFKYPDLRKWNSKLNVRLYNCHALRVFITIWQQTYQEDPKSMD